MPEVVLHEDADEEFKAAIRFYESRQPGLGEIFLQSISESFASIETQPLTG